jgi:hypothetical protein
MNAITKISSYISRYNGGWAAVATKEETEAHQALFQPSGRRGIESSEHVAPGVTWIAGVGYFSPKGERVGNLIE